MKNFKFAAISLAAVLLCGCTGGISGPNISVENTTSEMSSALAEKESQSAAESASSPESSDSPAESTDPDEWSKDIVPAPAEDFSFGEISLEVELENGDRSFITGVRLVKYGGRAAKLKLPDEINGQKVIAIDEDFTKFKYITDLVLPDTILSIGNGAFKECYIRNLKLPEKLVSIGDMAFASCASLKSVALPEGTKTIGEGAFMNCSALEKISIPKSVESIGGDAFDDTPWLKAAREKDPLVVVNDILIDGKTASGYIEVPANVKKISPSAFYDIFGNTEIKSVTLHTGLLEIGSWAFAGCKGISSLSIPDTVERIGCFAFDDTNINSITYKGKTYNMVFNDLYNY